MPWEADMGVWIVGYGTAGKRRVGDGPWIFLRPKLCICISHEIDKAKFLGITIHSYSEWFHPNLKSVSKSWSLKRMYIGLAKPFVSCSK